MLTLHINDQDVAVDVPPDKPLLFVLREELGLTGTKYCCGAGDCGVCTVHIDGEAAPSCRIPAGDTVGRSVVTIEGLAAARPDHPVFRAWEAEAVPQCGYCQPGQVMAAAALLARHPQPSREQIEEMMDHVLCRCGTYGRIGRALARLADGEFQP
ncbi:MAG TPA: (2Fe-2S)-binding protein [Gammaproteobacteria bacterium]|nr:(2Fe-2S)-binding protein [Gammaproteobacteria bacterium]